MPADAVMPISVVIERRASNSPWQDYVWRAVGVLPKAADGRGQLLASGEGWAQFQGGTLDLELFRGETEGYLTNLSQPQPVIFVVMRRADDAGELDYEPFLATACPYEAMGYTSSDDIITEGVPMPMEVMVWLQEFVALYHVDVPFKKRKNKQYQDDYGGKRRAGRDEKELR
jgi:Protein of unknown function (DUF3305)